PKGAALPASLPLPNLKVPAAEVTAWRGHRGLGESRAVALCPATVGPGRRWPVERYAALARALAADGIAVWVLGSPDDRPLATDTAKGGGAAGPALPGKALRVPFPALKPADGAVANDPGLLHVAAALETPAVGIFGPSSPYLTGPLTPLAAAIEPSPAVCATCGAKDCTRLDHRRTEDIPVEPVVAAVRRTPLPRLRSS